MVNRRLGRSRPNSAEHPGDHARAELLRRQAVTAADHRGHPLPATVSDGVIEGGDHIEEERFSEGARLFGAIQHRDTLARSKGSPRVSASAGNGPVQPDLGDSHPLPSTLKEGHRLAGRLAARSHHDQHPLGFGVPVIVDQPVVASGASAEAVHGCLDDIGGASVERVDGLAGLKVDIGILGGAAHERDARAIAPEPGGLGRGPPRPTPADPRRKATRWCSARARFGIRRRNAGTAPGWPVSPPGPRRPDRAPPAPMPTPGAPRRSGVRP